MFTEKQSISKWRYMHHKFLVTNAVEQPISNKRVTFINCVTLLVNRKNLIRFARKFISKLNNQMNEFGEMLLVFIQLLS